MDTAVAIPHACLANLLDASFEWGLSGAAGLVVVDRCIELQDLAGPLIEMPQSTSIPSISLRFRTGLRAFGG
jgi:hypothetical protein